MLGIEIKLIHRAKLYSLFYHLCFLFSLWFDIRAIHLCPKHFSTASVIIHDPMRLWNTLHCKKGHFSIIPLFSYLYLQIWSGAHQQWAVGHQIIFYNGRHHIQSQRLTNRMGQKKPFSKTSTTWVTRQFGAFLEEEDTVVEITSLENRKVIH